MRNEEELSRLSPRQRMRSEVSSIEMRSSRGLIRPCRISVLMMDSQEELWNLLCREWAMEKEDDPRPVPSWNESRAYWKKRLENETWQDWLYQHKRKREWAR